MPLRKKYIHEGEYVAEVEVALLDSDSGWGSYLSVEDATKLDEVREALRADDVKRVSRLASVHTLTPVSA